MVVEAESDFRVEYRDGGPDRHFATITDDADVAAHVLAGWADRVEGWDRQHQWERLRFS